MDRSMTGQFTVKTEEPSHNIEAQVFIIGEDILVAVHGGDRPHIGAVSSALPRPSLDDPEKTSSTASTLCFPGHKDDELTKKISQKISAAFGASVVVCAGVHFDSIDKEGIQKVIKNSEILTDMIIEKIKLQT